MKAVPYASACGSLMNAMLCTRTDICIVMDKESKYQSNPGQEHWSAIKTILKYLKRTREYMLTYKASDMLLVGYTDSDFQSNRSFRKSNSI